MEICNSTQENEPSELWKYYNEKETLPDHYSWQMTRDVTKYQMSHAENPFAGDSVT